MQQLRDKEKPLKAYQHEAHCQQDPNREISSTKDDEDNFHLNFAIMFLRELLAFAADAKGGRGKI